MACAEVPLWGFTMDNAAAGLMSGQHQHLGYLHVLRSTGGIEGHIANVVAREGLDASLDGVGALVVAVEAHVAEVGLH